MIRVFDVLFSALGLALCAPFLVCIAALSWLDTGSPLFMQIRVGRRQREFTLVKFRTMRLGTADVPTHMVSSAAVTHIGRFLRRSKLDELPQLWNVLIGDMSLVGPRPGLPCQAELVRARLSAGIFSVRPGVTGLSQLRGIDMSEPILLAQTDAEMVKALGVSMYFKCIVLTLLGRGGGDRIR